MARKTQQTTVTEHEFAGESHFDETHPAFGMIGASRVQNGGGGAILFDSDIRHQHSVRVRISTASRDRHLNRDWIRDDKQFVEVEMSEAQWASFVSSMNSQGVPCTIRRREDEIQVPEIPFEPRLEESMDEVATAGTKALKQIMECFEKVEEKPNKGNIRSLRRAIENAPSNMRFAAESLVEHSENVVQKARADIEAMVLTEATRLGIDPADLGGTHLLDSGEEE